MNEFQKPEEQEIDLIELIFYCLKRWRIVVVVMLIGAVAVGGYKYQATISENEAAAAEALAAAEAAAAAAEEEEEEEEAAAAAAASTDDAEAAKDGTIEYYMEGIAIKEAYIDKISEYIETSTIMNLDPYNVDQVLVSYYIDTEDDDLAETLSAAYKQYVTGGTLLALLQEADDSLPEADMNYLLSYSADELTIGDGTYSVTSDASSGTVEVVGLDATQPKVFRVTCYAASEEAAVTYGEVIQEALEGYVDELSEKLGAHSLELLEVNYKTVISSSIYSYQNTMRTYYSTALTELQTLRNNLSTAINDIEVDDTSTSVEVVENEDGTLTVEYDTESPLKNALLYALIGLIVGMVLAAFVLVLIDLLGGRLNSTGSFQELYGMALLGRITKLPKKKRFLGVIDQWIERLQEGAHYSMTCDEQMKIAAANIRTAAKNGGVQNVMIAGSLTAGEAENAYAQLVQELGGDAITCSAYERIVFSASALDDLEGYDGIIFLEKIGSTFMKLIDEERDLAVNRNVKILGAVVI